MPRPCHDLHEPSPATCRLCELAATDLRYQALWGLPLSKPLGGDTRPWRERMAQALACRHRGPSTSRQVPCGECGARHVLLDVLRCEKHGECTERPSQERGLHVCRGCPDRDPGPATQAALPAIHTRHLLYHVYPLRGDAGVVWRKNLQALCKRFKLFNGKRLVAVALDGRTEPVEAVREQFAGEAGGPVELLEVGNDPGLREVASLPALLSRAQTKDPGHAFFYGQSKGVTRPADSPVHLWAQTLYETMLDYWPLVHRLLRERPVAGSFKKVGQGWPSRESGSRWHFSGSFFWARCDALFSRRWTLVDHFRDGVEPYPSLHFSADEAATVFYEGAVSDMNLYDRGLWDRRILPALAAWHKEHEADRHVP